MSGAKNHLQWSGKTLDCVIPSPERTGNGEHDRKGESINDEPWWVRSGGGRPYDYREPLWRVTVALPESYIEQLRRFGDDNLSEGIRRLVEEALTASGRSWYVLPDWVKDPKASTHPPVGKRAQA